MTHFQSSAVIATGVESVEEEVMTDSCLKFHYVGNLVNMFVHVDYLDSVDPVNSWVDRRMNLGFPDWRPGQVKIPILLTKNSLKSGNNLVSITKSNWYVIVFFHSRKYLVNK